jgi:hypothetical protein
VHRGGALRACESGPITDWVTQADQDLLGALAPGRTAAAGTPRGIGDTIKRVLHALGSQGLAEHLGLTLAELRWGRSTQDRQVHTFPAPISAGDVVARCRHTVLAGTVESTRPGADILPVMRRADR